MGTCAGGKTFRALTINNRLIGEEHQVSLDGLLNIGESEFGKYFDMLFIRFSLYIKF